LRSNQFTKSHLTPHLPLGARCLFANLQAKKAKTTQKAVSIEVAEVRHGSGRAVHTQSMQIAYSRSQCTMLIAYTSSCCVQSAYLNQPLAQNECLLIGAGAQEAASSNKTAADDVDGSADAQKAVGPDQSASDEVDGSAVVKLPAVSAEISLAQHDIILDKTAHHCGRINFSRAI
jgi:hypothetical protein